MKFKDNAYSWLKISIICTFLLIVDSWVGCILSDQWTGAITVQGFVLAIIGMFSAIVACEKWNDR